MTHASRSPWTSILGALGWVLLLGFAGVGRGLAQPSEVPSHLVFRFDVSARALDQAPIREAVQRELGTQLLSQGTPDSASLTLFVTERQELALVYEPERTRLTRSVPFAHGTDIPALVSHLAGNLVRDEATSLVSELDPPRADRASPRTPAPWALTLLFGGQWLPLPHGVATLQLSRRFGRLELGLAAEFAAGRTWGMEGATGGFFVSSAAGPAVVNGPAGVNKFAVPTLEFTVPLSLDVDLMRRESGYMQLGALAGYRMAGVYPGYRHLSGSDSELALALRLTVGLHVRARRTLVLRGTLGILPDQHATGAGDRYIITDAFGSSLQLGYVIGF
jgi:hypothetical protein